MDKEKQNSEIAKFAGYENIRMSERYEVSDDPYNAVILMGYLHQTKTAIPDYVQDLNSMHEIENTLTDEQFAQYHRELRVILSEKCLINGEDWARPVHRASASDRAHAFLLTIGKWTE